MTSLGETKHLLNIFILSTSFWFRHAVFSCKTLLKKMIKNVVTTFLKFLWSWIPNHEFEIFWLVQRFVCYLLMLGQNNLWTNRKNLEFRIREAIGWAAYSCNVKVHIFWEGHKILWKFPLTFVLYVVPVKGKVMISQNFVAFSDYMNFKRHSNLI